MIDADVSDLFWFHQHAPYKWGCKRNILCTYLRNVKIVMHSPYYIHTWHLNLPCGFTENFPATTWDMLVKSKEITHLIITWRNKWVCKIGKFSNDCQEALIFCLLYVKNFCNISSENLRRIGAGILLLRFCHDAWQSEDHRNRWEELPIPYVF